jgi:EAL domain-containing protein (putative c-di-GMP-specific phosphodiesterase class I)
MLAQNLHLNAVAEGIETEDQLRQLQTLGCEFGQGYLFSKPVAVAEAQKLLSKGLEFKVVRLALDAPFALESDTVFEVAEIQ